MDTLHNLPAVTPEALRSFRRAQGLSQQELATLLGVGIATISRWENGTVPTGTAAAILRTLLAGAVLEHEAAMARDAGYSIYQLLKGVFEPKEASNHKGKIWPCRCSGPQ